LLSKNVEVKIVLNECETWSLMLTKNRLLRRIFGQKRDEITGG
jgi:hypothetical protein